MSPTHCPAVEPTLHAMPLKQRVKNASNAPTKPAAVRGRPRIHPVGTTGADLARMTDERLRERGGLKTTLRLPPEVAGPILEAAERHGISANVLMTETLRLFTGYRGLAQKLSRTK